MKDEWIKLCLQMMATPADEYSGARKIVGNVVHTMEDIGNELIMEDLGYTKSKMSMLKRLYLVEESRNAVVPLWEKRLSQRKGELMNQGSIMVKLLEHANTRMELATQLALRKLRVRLTKKKGGPHGEGKETG